jgi:hypothetical protein
MIPDQTLARSFQILDNLSPGDILDLERIAEERRDLFLQCAEQYQKTYNNLELNNSRNKLKKYESIRRTSQSTPTDSKQRPFKKLK